jgi:transposase
MMSRFFRKKSAKMSRRAAGRHYEVSESVAIKWLERLERHGSREPVGDGGHRTSKLTQHRDFLRAAQAEKSDITAKRPQPFAWRGPRRSAAG